MRKRLDDRRLYLCVYWFGIGNNIE